MNERTPHQLPSSPSPTLPPSSPMPVSLLFVANREQHSATGSTPAFAAADMPLEATQQIKWLSYPILRLSFEFKAATDLAKALQDPKVCARFSKLSFEELFYFAHKGFEYTGVILSSPLQQHLPPKLVAQLKKLDQSFEHVAHIRSVSQLKTP